MCNGCQLSSQTILLCFNRLTTNFLCRHGYFVYYIFSYNFLFFNFSKSLECKYNKLKFGIRIGFVEASKHKLHIATSLCLQQNLQQRNPSIQEHLLSQE